MAYQVIARKWRPQQFDDVVGQGHVMQTLKNAIESDRVAHAYLFVGPRGTGKTTTARILAKALNCEKGPLPTPCDTCDSCKEIMAGSHLDVLEIDGASNNGVDQVRDLRDNVRYAPTRGPFKIYIIDEVHMLSVPAFNALLKTLEEPPKHVKFFLATTEPQKVPATILSRCQRFDLRRISATDIISRLSEIAKAEGVDIDEEALLAIARGAEGGLRDGQSALDQLIAFRGKTICEDDVLSIFGLVARETLDELVAAVLGGEVARLIDIVAELDRSGKDMQRLVIELLEYFRNLLVFLHTGQDSAGLEITDLEAAALKKHAGTTDPDRILRVIGYLTEAEGRMRYALSKRTLLETALIRSARAATIVGIETILEQLNRLKANLGTAGVPRQDPQKKTGPLTDSTHPEPPSDGASTPPRAGKDELGMLTAGWKGIVDRVGQVAPLARNYLLDAKPVRVKADVVTIGFDPEFADSRTKIDFPRNVKALEKSLEAALSRTVKVTFSVLNAQDTLPGDTKFVAKKRDVPLEPKVSDPVKRKQATKTREEWVDDPAVRKTLEMFNGDIVDIRE